MYKVDLHTHSIASPDGSLTLENYGKMLEDDTLNVIAITDHNTISFAQKAEQKLGASIIIGEEITTARGEIIGLYLINEIAPGQSLAETAKAIHAQGGLVYIPHPFETVRKGVTLDALNEIAEFVDIVEVQNGRAIFQNRSDQAAQWAQKNEKVVAASSDAHGWHGWGKTYSVITDVPQRETLLDLLHQAKLQTGNVGFRGVFYPKINRLRKKGAI